MPTIPDPLEKQLMHMTLGKGLNERDRPETADPATTLTRVENLVQDQSGAWVKRPGLEALGDGPDTCVASKLLRLKDGLGVAAENGKFFRYAETLDEFRQRGRLSEFTLSSAVVESSGVSVGGDVYSTSSSTGYHCVVHNAGIGISDAQPAWLISVYDRQAGCVIGQYDAARLIAPGTVITGVAAFFVDDRYLHIYIGQAGEISGIVMDTQNLPASGEESATYASSTALAVGDMWDYTAGPGRSYLLTLPTSTTSFVVSMNNAGAMIQSQVVDEARQIMYTAAHAQTGVAGIWCLAINDVRSYAAATLVALGATTSHGGNTFTDDVVASIDSGGFFYVADAFADTLGGTTVNTVRFYKGASAGGTTINQFHCAVQGWYIASSPFEVTVPLAERRSYLHMYKEYSAGDASPHVLVSMETDDCSVISASYLPYVADHFYYSARLAAMVEPSFADSRAKRLRRALATTTSKTEVGLYVPLLTTARGTGFAVTSASVSTVNSGCVSSNLGYTNYISGGLHCAVVGNAPVEVGFADIPAVSAVATATAGSVNGSVKYVAVHRAVDESGAVVWSRVSPVASANPSNKKVTVTASAATVTARDKQLGYDGGGSPDLSPCTVVLEMYRTAAGGTVYYLVGGTQASADQVIAMDSATAGGAKWVLLDDMADATLTTKAQLFRQPGVTNSPIDRYPPPGGNLLCQHKDRLFTVDTYGARVCYSSFFVDGETTWFNPAFSFFAHGGTGPITAMVSMDGRLFIFKRDAVFVVDGDGPAEGGVTGAEFSPPQRLAIEYGCISHRSVAVTSEGIVYRSDRGVEFLTRSLKNKFIGDRVQTTVGNNANTDGCVLDGLGRYHLLVSDGAGSQTELTYDFTADAWCTAVYAMEFADLCAADLPTGNAVCYSVDGPFSIYKKSSTSWLDDATYVPWVVETAWIRTGQQVRQRISRGLMLAKSRTNHKITIAIAYNFVDSYTQSLVFEPDITNVAAAIEELEIQVSRPDCLAIRLRITESEPTDTTTYPVTTGQGCELLGITFEIAVKQGPPMLSAGRKGALVVSSGDALVTEGGDTLTTEGGDTLVLES